MTPHPMKKKRQTYVTFRIGTAHIKKVHAIAQEDKRTVRATIENAIDAAVALRPKK